ncbi:histone-fold-containing protein [Pholiota conissans]|uniref:Histone-fold-containing protein n=1 Tax=Pholiota conissans TaxID=109636 RepID=A0A9P5Z9Z9_9AGAR|nr:histone-fold-containing protein [Pholiota conissans]
MKNKNKQTKFPVARIKKIMQKDEEVGKVAQATPIVISKALELFLGLIIEESAKVTTERGSKKVEVYHLKHAVETTETLDFLKELVQDIPDPSAGGTIDFESENAEAKKKRGKGRRAPADPNAPKRRRKKKADSEPSGDGDDAPPRSAEMNTPPEDEEMHDTTNEDEYDEDEDKSRPAAAASTSYRPRSPSDAEDEEEDKPFMPRK